MEEQLSKEQMLSTEALVASHSYEMIALITVLEKKGILTRGEVIQVIEELQKNSKG
jgi:hypothetical protein